MTESTPLIASPEPSVEGFVREYLRELNFTQGTVLERASTNDKYLALARTVRHYLMASWMRTTSEHLRTQPKAVAYLSAEYLLGRQLDNALIAADLTDIASEALASLGIDVAELREAEVEPGLGNGGLGRLAACFIDSLATMAIPAIGYGIRYEYGIFRQKFEDGWQVEKPDRWLDNGSPWEFAHPEHEVTVSFGGHVETVSEGEGADAVETSRWVPGWEVLGVPYNYMVPGYRNGCVNTLRLWSARATHAFNLETFNYGDYAEAVRAQTFAENISKVLYPEDSTPQGKELRLQQQYFFVACSLRDFIDQLLPQGFDLHRLPERVCFQLNDTHPVIAVPELMRILVDEEGFAWDEAWEVTQGCFAYTCHTLLPEALEVWPVDLLGRLLPRHLEIIYRINDEFLEEVREASGDDAVLVRRMSIIAEHPGRAVRMAHLATVAATKVNGVAELHSQLLRDKVLADFARLWPEKFTNVTNGVTPRRFVRMANPRLSELITEAIGDGWVTDLDRLRELEPLADDPEFRRRFREVKSANKERLADFLARRDGIEVPVDTMLDVMVKRLHEYKRQTLQILHVITLYDGIVSGRLALEDVVPRTVVFGAKAAPGYAMAKQIIGLINHVAAVVNNHPEVSRVLRVAFPANYNVTVAETLIPAADLSEQISLAGKEASGTGNMKFALNGALTIGTDDGANVEIRQLVGDDHFFLFGLTEPEAAAVAEAGYRPATYYEENATLRRALDLIARGEFSGGDRQTFEPIVSNLLGEDRFMVLADYQSYLDAQQRVEAAYRDPDAWSRSAVLNVARSGFFSSDRSMRDYLDRIWHAEPLES
ncbi:MULTISPECIES: glycogen/starch/alpha-glucan phosphorylase [Isoptericola]|uniref:glycogen/starch/alpha-glucan phosphorylase n=1 Tax=Isoptericola TaxID=254250 RepID=UPI00271402C6|nr:MULTISPECIES: glycogen/starch/alpha-glucan phosphorylase [unclassified Isoptericola]MDO8145365.1 glycogen/starch/alpha-glucan phosphorylase [Isoptericola sp. 178]MDO8149006.1 glycogen/starch/alpha-glucan phosphorylase [Isoptericola sp. b515]MDO8151054.1 glycogen/starch/alpha-glucan phosphorylase [Isoptericola sp. b408]